MISLFEPTIFKALRVVSSFCVRSRDGPRFVCGVAGVVVGGRKSVGARTKMRRGKRRTGGIYQTIYRFVIDDQCQTERTLRKAKSVELAFHTNEERPQETSGSYLKNEQNSTQ